MSFLDRLRSRRRDTPPSGDMLEVLEWLGIPADFGVSDPTRALIGGMTKAAIHQAYVAIERGDAAAALAHLDTVFEAPELQTSEYADMAAAAWYLRGCAHELENDRAGAAAAHQTALDLVANYSHAAEALQRLGDA